MKSFWNSIIIFLFLLASACASEPKSGDPFQERMQEIDRYSMPRANESEDARRNREYAAGQARISEMNRRNSVHGSDGRNVKRLRSALVDRDCSRLLPYLALEKFECKVVYRYTAWVYLRCEDLQQKLKQGISVIWQVANNEGYAQRGPSDSVSFSFDQKRTIKSSGEPPIEDENSPDSFILKIADETVPVQSKLPGNTPAIVPRSLCE